MLMQNWPRRARNASETCKESMMNWWDQYTALENASKQGSCDGIAFSWGETLAEWVLHSAWYCCHSKPASICAPDLKKVTPCKDRSDFNEEVVLRSLCDTPPSNESACTAAGCHWWSETWCSCEDATSCEAGGGTWTSYTCGDEFFNNMGLNKVENGTPCEDVFLWDSPITSSVNWAAEQCCSSWPASRLGKTSEAVAD
eukprot:Skav214647  [mRNA]  locus=scaffold1660:19528:26874:- [translate_table: standard]